MSAVHKSKLRVKALGACIMPGDFQVNSVNLELTRRLLDKLHGLALPTLDRDNFRARKIHPQRRRGRAVRDCSQRSARCIRRRSFRADKPDTAETRLAQQTLQSAARLFQIKRMMIKGVIFTHHWRGIKSASDSAAIRKDGSMRSGDVFDRQRHPHAATHAQSRHAPFGLAL